MKTQLFLLALLAAAAPAGASVNTAETSSRRLVIEPAALVDAPRRSTSMQCGQSRNMMFILRNSNGAIIAMGVLAVKPSC